MSARVPSALLGVRFTDFFVDRRVSGAGRDALGRSGLYGQFGEAVFDLGSIPRCAAETFPEFVSLRKNAPASKKEPV